MPFNARLRVGVAAAAIAMLSASPLAAAAKQDNSAKLHRLHDARAHYRPQYVSQRSALPYSPNYGFLTRVPRDAIRMPGYTFVPGKGILGESCDLPTSACSNQYRVVE